MIAYQSVFFGEGGKPHAIKNAHATCDSEPEVSPPIRNYRTDYHAGESIGDIVFEDGFLKFGGNPT
jgi:hypothetical protein